MLIPVTFNAPRKLLVQSLLAIPYACLSFFIVPNYCLLAYVYPESLSRLSRK